MHTTIPIQTEDGIAPTHLFQPDAPGPWPGVILYMDGLGMRPALLEIAERLANAGYYVMLPDLFYRIGYTAAEGMKIWTDAKALADFKERVLPSVTIANIMRDTRAFLSHLNAEPKVRTGKFGAVGYCMGGRQAMAAAGHFPDRFAAAASFHPSGLATDAPDSPHLLAPVITARLYIAGAIEDRGFDDAQKVRLAEALTAANVDFQIETYDARHGWVPSDTPTHDDAAAERHWRALLDLFGETLSAGRGDGGTTGR